jgi:phenylpropionate dioxygenase-like ring-hydroxylating dioxygenase large terminal subunit
MSAVPSDRAGKALARLDLDPAEIRSRLDAGHTLPAELYHDPALYELEQQVIFRPMWHYVGVEQQLAKVGDYVTTEVAGIPIVVVRDEEERLRAHVNICRHRLHPVADGSGNRKTLQCPYHGWTYGLSGCLRSAPRSEESALDFAELALLPAHVASWRGIVFVSLEPDEPLDAYIGGLPEVMDETHFEWSVLADPSLYLYSRFEQRLACNWKVAWENALECYHCPIVHRDTFSQYYQVDAEGYVNGTYDRGLYGFTSFRAGAGEGLGLGDEQPAISFYWLFPSSSISGGPKSGGVTLTRFLPRGPEACVRRFDNYRIAGVDDTPFQELTDAFAATLQEDIGIVAQVQAAARSGGVRYGTTMPVSETNIRAFNELVWNRLEPAFD